MILSEYEIIRSYKDALDKNIQVDILAQICECTKNDIENLLELNGIFTVNKVNSTSHKKKKGIRWADEINNLKALRAKGYSMKECGEMYGVSNHTIRDALRRYA